MFGMLCNKVCLCSYRDLCSMYRQDQEVCAAVLLGLLPSIRSLGKTHHPQEDMRHVQGSLLQVVSGFWSAFISLHVLFILTPFNRTQCL